MIGRGPCGVACPLCSPAVVPCMASPLPCSSRHSAYLPQFRLTTPPVTVRSPVMVTFPFDVDAAWRDGQVHAAVGCPQAQGPGGEAGYGVARRCGCRPQRQHHPPLCRRSVLGVCLRTSSDNGVTVPVQVDHHADVPGLVDRTDDKAAPVDGSHGTARTGGFGLGMCLRRITGDRLKIDGQGRLVKGKDLYNASATQRPAASACFLASS